MPPLAFMLEPDSARPAEDRDRDATARLLRRAQAGDADAFCDLVRVEEARLLRQALLLSGDAALAEDLAQETLFTVWKRLGQFDGRCRLFTWMCGILLNLARNTARKKIPVPVSLLPADSRRQAGHAIESALDPAGSPDERLQRIERSQSIQRCLDRLPEKHREIIHLRFFVDDSLEGIAAALGCSIGTVKSRLFHALEKLNAMPELNQLAQPKDTP